MVGESATAPPTESPDFQTLQGTLRLKLLDLYRQANAGHIGCSLSCIDLMIATLVLRKREPDTFILSKGHAAVSLYTCLNHLGHISDAELATFYHNGTRLPAHPAPLAYPQIPFATGSLGHGLPIGAGIALANKLLDQSATAPATDPPARVFVLMSDGETNEGTTWEAAHFAIQHELDNLVVLIDKNGLQGFGQTANVLGDTADAHVWAAMGFDTAEVDGHDIDALLAVIDQPPPTGQRRRPRVIMAHTVKGKGVSYMENQLMWHYLPMNPDQYEQAYMDVQERYLTTPVQR